MYQYMTLFQPCLSCWMIFSIQLKSPELSICSHLPITLPILNLYAQKIIDWLANLLICNVLRWVRNCANNLLLYKQNDISDSDHWQKILFHRKFKLTQIAKLYFCKVNGFVIGCNIRCKMNEYIQYFVRNYLILSMYSVTRKYNINNKCLEHKDLI